MNPPKGWECPCCGRVWAPWVAECTKCKRAEQPPTIVTVADPADTVPGANYVCGSCPHSSHTTSHFETIHSAKYHLSCCWCLGTGIVTNPGYAATLNSHRPYEQDLKFHHRLSTWRCQECGKLWPCEESLQGHGQVSSDRP